MLLHEAIRTQNYDALQAALSDEYIAEQQHYDSKKQLLEEWKQAAIDAHCLVVLTDQCDVVAPFCPFS